MAETEVVNRFRLFQRRIEQGLDRDKIRADLRRESIEYGYKIRNRIRELAPSGEKWTDPPEIKRDIRRPSLRQHGITLEDSWQDPVVDFVGSTGTTIQSSVSISSIAPQAEWVIEGTPDHVIPVRNFDKHLYFWHFRDAVVRRPKVVGHPGHAGSDFVERAMEEIDDEASSRFNQMIDLIMNRFR